MEHPNNKITKSNQSNQINIICTKENINNMGNHKHLQSTPGHKPSPQPSPQPPINPNPQILGRLVMACKVRPRCSRGSCYGSVTTTSSQCTTTTPATGDPRTRYSGLRGSRELRIARRPDVDDHRANRVLLVALYRSRVVSRQIGPNWRDARPLGRADNRLPPHTHTPGKNKRKTQFKPKQSFWNRHSDFRTIYPWPLIRVR
jgi:hypothetical protein